MNVYWVLLAGAVVTSMFGQMMLKSGAGVASILAQLVDWRTLLGLAFYGGSAMMYIVALRRIPVSKALPCTAVSYVVVALIGHFYFNEPITPMHIAAIALIVGGVAVLALA